MVNKDSHNFVIETNQKKEQIEKEDMLPFIEAIKEGADSILVGHILIKDIDKKYPASLSKKIINGYLIEKYNFKGLIVTDDIKQGGPYMSLLQFDDDIMPFTCTDILILRYLIGISDEKQTLREFEMINSASELNWVFKSQLSKFIRRFFKNPYREEDTIWLKKLAENCNIKIKRKLESLSRLL